MGKLREIVNGSLNYQANELRRLENTIDHAFLDAVHELLDELRLEDIHSLEEEVFA